MKIDRRPVVRMVGLMICFILACLVVNYLLVHLPDFIRSIKKWNQ